MTFLLLVSKPLYILSMIKTKTYVKQKKTKYCKPESEFIIDNFCFLYEKF